ncbi:MAG TPA: hypothetical protein VMA77_13825 [Solirubrobacteraceae bacterium]|nr:hypothetical protein [Solirubrobacteraceae bacterium]
MKTDDLDHELSRLKQASQRIAANLVEIEIDSSRQLLEAVALTGASAARWAEASAALTDLWAWRALLDDLLARADKLPGSRRRTDELRSLLQGASIELTRAPIPLAERDLLGSAEVTARCTPDELIARMSSAFDEAKTVVAEFTAAWDALIPPLTSARAALERARGLAARLGESESADLVEAANRVESLTTIVGADPLSAQQVQVDSLLDSLAAVIGEARAAHDEAVMKVAVPTAPPPPELPDDPSAELDEIERLARSGAWRETGGRLDRWTSRTAAALDDPERNLYANRAPLEARRQLRGLLEAYQLKAGRLGAIEDLELERIYAQAHEALYTAPTDLARMARLVRRYQEIVSNSGTRPAREAVR